MVQTNLSSLLGGRYKLGGRAPGVEIDCMGITMEAARRRGLPLEDPWARLQRLTHEGRCVPDGSLGEGWRRVSKRPGDDHVVILETHLDQGVGFVLGGYVYTAIRDIGGVALPLDRVKVMEVWEHDSVAH